MRNWTDRAWVLLALLLAFLVACAAPAWAQQPVSHETTAVSNSTAVGLLASTTNPTGAGPITECAISVENGAIRFWVDGTAPTGTSGHLVAAGGPPIVIMSISAATGFQAIAINQAAALQTTCFRGSTTLPALAFFGSPGRLPPCNGVQATNCTAKGF